MMDYKFLRNFITTRHDKISGLIARRMSKIANLEVTIKLEKKLLAEMEEEQFKLKESLDNLPKGGIVPGEKIIDSKPAIISKDEAYTYFENNFSKYHERGSDKKLNNIIPIRGSDADKEN